MFKTIASTIGRVLGTDKAAESLINNTSNALDKLVYTSEEKADAEAKDRAEARAMIIRWMEATSGQNLARRLLAISITFVWLAMFCVAGVLKAVAPWVDKEVTIKIMASATSIGQDAIQISGAVMLILAFYFAAPHMGAIVKPALDRFANNK